MKNKSILFAICFTLLFQFTLKASCEEFPTTSGTKYPDYSTMFLGEDRLEGVNRKIFRFNGALNKVIVKPVHILWASVMPKYGMDRLKGVYNNIEYPKRLVSSLIQKDFKASGRETVRFLTNSTIGLGGMFDPAKTLFNLPECDETMEQALCKCKCNQGPYMVVPVLQGTTPRGLCGKALDTALNPTCYIATPVLALIKLGFTINNTSYFQPLADMIESNFADPYDIAKKLYGADCFIKSQNLDRESVLAEKAKELNGEDYAVCVPSEGDDAEKSVNIADTPCPDAETVSYADLLKEGITKNSYELKMSKPKADLVLEDYNPQTPSIDAMRTALFTLPGIDESIWSDLSIWNRSFSHRIKQSGVQVYPNRAEYKFRYIMQKDKNAPVAIIYPSIGEGIKSHHSVVFAKLFYDKGFSVVIQGSAFQWEFASSMPEGYYPGNPSQDAKYLQETTAKILQKLEEKYDVQFGDKVVMGTSFGAITCLFVANEEYKTPKIGITKFISVNPPIELVYAMRQVDKNNEEWLKNPDNLRDRVAVTSAKILNLYNKRNDKDFKIGALPFTDYEAKLITSFVMHQKLSDLVFSLSGISQTQNTSEIYKKINNMNFEDYMHEYVLGDGVLAFDDLNYDTSLYSISDYLQNNDNYKIYHALDDYLVNNRQLTMLKKYTGDNSVYFSNGSHLGFMYRQEFLDAVVEDITNLRKEIALKNLENYRLVLK